MKIIKNKKFIIVTAIVSVLVIVCGIYVSDYYRADGDAIEAFTAESAVVKQEFDGGTAYIPDETAAGFIFYPGGKVEYTAYEPLMTAVAERGILCVAVEMPFNLAVLDVNAADEIFEMYPEIGTWYIGGHSLGGSMAASYAADNGDKVDGVILLASYSTADLSKGGFEVLSVKGSEDKVLNSEKYEEYKPNLPETAEEVTIVGGNHGGFGMYGEQEGDGKSTLAEGEQINITAERIADTVLK